MLDPKIEKAFNGQLNAEMYSAYLYLAMAAHFEAINLKGFANWMRCQVQEETVHVMKFYDFILERNGKVALTVIEGPPTTWDLPVAVFESAYAHEQKVTGLINALVDLASEVRDHASQAFLQWFVTEQVEEEASADGVVQKLKLVADAPGGLFILDQELAQRVVTLPPAEGQAQ